MIDKIRIYDNNYEKKEEIEHAANDISVHNIPVASLLSLPISPPLLIMTNYQ